MEIGVKMQLKPQISVIMGSKSDWSVMKLSCDTLENMQVPYEVKIISAHRTPDRLYDFATKVGKRKIKVIIAGAGGAAHLPGMTASLTTVPVLGVPIKSHSLNGLDSLLSIVQMPSGIPVGTLAIGEAGAINAAIFAVSIIANYDTKIGNNLKKWRSNNTKNVPLTPN